jgi:hypothetical protein
MKKNIDSVILKIGVDDLNPFVAYLTLGVLYSIQTKNVSINVGIWSIGRPNFYMSLKNILPEKIYKLLEMCDELSALEKLDSVTFNQEIKNMIEILQSYLKKNDDPNFLVEWHVDDKFMQE